MIHKAASTRTFEEDDGHHSVDVGTVWEMLQCRGCDDVTMTRVQWTSEDDRQDGPVPPSYFPPRFARRMPEWFGWYKTPREYYDLLGEVYAALNADSRRLAMMGARAVIDVVIQKTVGDKGDFKKGLDALAAANHMSERDVDALATAIDVGHASAHRAHKPTLDDVNVVIDIIERLIHSEILATEAKVVKARTPQRPAKVSKEKP